MKLNKNWAVVAAIALLGVGLLSNRSVKGDQHHLGQQNYAAIFLSFEYTYEYRTNAYGSVYSANTGLIVDWVDASVNAPKIQRGGSAAQAIADLLNSGLTRSGDSYLFTGVPH